jgi:hypothetical protein
VIQIRGASSGRSYAFSPHARVQWVDTADSRALLRSRFFRVTTERG